MFPFAWAHAAALDVAHLMMSQRCAVRSLVQLAAFSRLRKFHLKILRLLLILLVWVHWDACLNYGVCAYEPPPRH